MVIMSAREVSNQMLPMCGFRLSTHLLFLLMSTFKDRASQDGDP